MEECVPFKGRVSPLRKKNGSILRRMSPLRSQNGYTYRRLIGSPYFLDLYPCLCVGGERGGMAGMGNLKCP